MRTVVLGFDPGGINQFGWCTAEADNGDARIRLIASGIADAAEPAVAAALRAAGDISHLQAAGIDSPLFWSANGDRQVDRIIRDAMILAGARNVHGTVQQVNSLRGACLAQGIMAADLLRRRSPSIRLTESHPKALLWLLKVATKDRRTTAVTLEHLLEFIECDAHALTEHERDAALGAVAALAMVRHATGWRDLVPDEQEPFILVSPVEYWMPLPPQSSGLGT